MLFLGLVWVTAWTNCFVASAPLPAERLNLQAHDCRGTLAGWFNDQLIPIQRGFGTLPPLAQKVEIRRVGHRWVSDRHSFQVWVGPTLIATLPNRVRAEDLAGSVQRLLRDVHLNPAAIVPTLVSGQPAIEHRNRVYLVVDPQFAAELNRNAELAVIQWVNQLRVALAAAPLALTTAQAQMYGLSETPETLSGLASWYGPYFHGRLTATGEAFDQTELTAAHPFLPFGTYLKVTNLNNGNTVIVRINDRGPYIDDRSLDLSREAARQLDSEMTGVVPYQAIVMEPTRTTLVAQR
ncbi:septal ring lytic transglycosylase RlpA family protein [Trichothermofontia sichuanensis B231]|uniref:septal ring lytic transglycosylase RlpA family protein n=1 Tax=Trichothermofontia sichuanensis TaxID=3045816 RepID=UPI00224586B8|nr:septal ring lytic transglycosylase RlpA family protein [Trichothermofontia sichuanensis]UZQ52928.1 septal ring lytic transglycosylase RlpA family protein [Trichothermofontia sichuanensis B231]